MVVVGTSMSICIMILGALLALAVALGGQFAVETFHHCLVGEGATRDDCGDGKDAADQRGDRGSQAVVAEGQRHSVREGRSVGHDRAFKGCR